MPNSDEFYRCYPYRPDVEFMKPNKKYKIPTSYDSKAHFRQVHIDSLLNYRQQLRERNTLALEYDQQLAQLVIQQEQQQQQLVQQQQQQQQEQEADLLSAGGASVESPTSKLEGLIDLPPSGSTSKALMSNARREDSSRSRYV